MIRRRRKFSQVVGDIEHNLQSRSPETAADITPRLDSEFGLRQLSEIVRSLPILACYHLFATALVGFLVSQSATTLRLWLVACAITAGAVVALLYKTRSFLTNAKEAAFLLRAMPVVALVIAALWSIPPLAFISSASINDAALIYGVTLIVWVLGVITWLRMPSVAVSFATFVGVVMCWSIYSGLADHQLIFTLVCASFWLSLVGLVLTMHFDFERRTCNDIEMVKQGEIIKLLLNDFERGTKDWLWEINAKSEFTYFSPRLEEVLGLTKSELMRTNFDIIFDNQTLLENIAGQVEFLDQTVRISVGDVEYLWHLKASALFNTAGEFGGYRGVGRDVTNQHRAESEMVSAKEAAESASAAKSQFLAIISHELRTPINAIVGFCEVLNADQSEQISKSDRRNYFSSVIENAKHLQNLINDILDATRLERGSFKLVEQNNDAAEIVEAALKVCRKQADDNQITIIAHLVDDISVFGDMTRLKQVLLNIISNAIKFSPSNSIVNVEMKRGDEQQLVVVVRDAGIGIGVEDAKRVFEPFVQIDEGSARNFGGMGLGLAIAKRIAQLHGGDVTLVGLAGVGTEAKLILPQQRVVWPAQQAASKGVAA